MVHKRKLRLVEGYFKATPLPSGNWKLKTKAKSSNHFRGVSGEWKLGAYDGYWNFEKAK